MTRYGSVGGKSDGDLLKILAEVILLSIYFISLFMN